MFERSRIDNSQQQGAIPARVTLDDGTTLKGRFYAAMGRGFAEILNGASQFLEFEPYGGERAFISKSAFRSVQLTGAPATQNLHGRLKDTESFDPFTILGVKPGCTPEEIRSAYHARAKVYHPDRYANAELPEEVGEYLASMARRINAAYAALEEPIKEARKSEHRRAEAVYTSSPRV